MLKIAIIEDEQPALIRLVEQLECAGNNTIVLQHSAPLSFIKLIKGLAIDLIFVDINLPDINGIELIEQLRAQGFTGEYIFTTAYSEFAVDAFTLGATDYLLKPFNQERLQLALSRLKKSQESANTASSTVLKSKLGDKVSFVDVAEIDTVKLEHGQTVAVCRSRSYPLDQSLEDIQTQLPEYFLRVHRNAIVNTRVIASLERWVTGGYLVHLSRSETQVITSRNGARALKQKLKL